MDKINPSTMSKSIVPNFPLLNIIHNRFIIKQNKIPPIKPSHVFFGEIAVANLF